MLTALGRYGLLVLDSWTRPAYARLCGRKASDRTIQRRFRKYRGYGGLAFWPRRSPLERSFRPAELAA